jgi:hypothetical protein
MAKFWLLPKMATLPQMAMFWLLLPPLLLLPLPTTTLMLSLQPLPPLPPLPLLPLLSAWRRCTAQQPWH